ncbi:hypothetical protein C8R44DRAFT_803558 [Mycena epipterygia]|nr:hypothetical protein C8R44DRAFT_803558 [Mycena epipterygia]
MIRVQFTSDCSKMPAQKRGRRNGPKPDLPSGTTVQLPQELIDAIIDEFDIFLQDTHDSSVFPDRKTLRSCALVARAFARPSQMRLFSTVNLYKFGYGTRPPDERARLFSKLISSSTHIGLYVQHLLLSYRSARSNSVVHILSCLPKLKSLSLHPWCDIRHEGNPPFSIHLKDSFLAAFSLSSLRCLELRAHKFTNPLELESILSNSVQLKELTLSHIKFTDIPAPTLQTRLQAPPRVVLHSITVFQMKQSDVDAVVNTFTVVNTTHLRSVCCDDCHESLLKANAYSIQELTLILRSDPRVNYPHHHAFHHSLPADNSLHSLNLRLYASNSVSLLYRQLENLANVKSLKRIVITVPGHMEHDLFIWTKLNSMLAEVDLELEAIEIQLDGASYRNSEDPEPVLRRSLPALDAKGFLNISWSPPSDEWKYMAR